MSALVTAFERLIPPDFTLKREGNYWIVETAQAGAQRHHHAVSGAARTEEFFTWRWLPLFCT